MSSKTYKARALVLKKTKLKEKDLIVTMLQDDGCLLQGVAKGARRPGGSFAARLELFSEVEVLMAKGRSLDVVCDAKLTGLQTGHAAGIEQSACAAPLAELLCALSQPGLPQPRVFDISKAAFNRMLDRSCSPETALAISCASLWKVLSQSGFRPSLSRCALCYEPIGVESIDGDVALSVEDGGVVCPRCPRPAGAFLVNSNTLRWLEALISLRFDEIAEAAPDTSTCFSAFEVARMWARSHTGRDLKSLDFLITSGLFV